MKHIDYSFTDSDIQTCLFALTQLHLLHTDEVTDEQIFINEQCALSVSAKLSSRSIETITPNELRVLCCCITLCSLICQGTISVDNETYKACTNYIFSLNKLDNELCSQLM